MTWHIASRIVAKRTIALLVIPIKDEAEKWNAFKFENCYYWYIAGLKLYNKYLETVDDIYHLGIM